MDFDNSGVESDSRTKVETDTLEQKNEPIISFSPQRCRFDSVQSNSRKSSTSFPISVEDLQLNDPLISSCSTSGQQNSSVNNVTPNSSTANNALSNSTSISQIVGPQQQQPPFANVHNHLSQTQTQAPQHQSYSFSHNPSALSSSSSSSASSTLIGVRPAAAVINAFSPSSSSSSSTLNSTSSTTHPFASTSKSLNNRTPLLPPANNSLASSADKNSISLMVNGAVLSTNNNSSTSTALDLQKRLERRIAQASAVASAASSSSAKTKASDSILSDIIATTTTTSSNTGVVNNNAVIDPIGANGNQISFSPQNSSSSSKQQKMLGSLPSSLWEPDPSDAELEDLLWESKKAPSISNAGDSSSKSEMKSLLDNSPRSVNHIDDSENNVESNEKPVNTYELEQQQKLNEIAHANTTTTSPSKANPGINSSNNNNNAKASKCNTSNKNNASKSSQSTRTGSSCSGSNSTSHASQSSYTSASTATPSSSTSVIVVNSGFDIRKVSALLPPQRLAIPCKQSNSQLQSSRSMATSNDKMTDDNEAVTATFSSSSFKPGGMRDSHKTSSRNTSVSETSCIDGNASGTNSVLKGNGNAKAGSHSSKLSSEKKPLVQWDSDESEEELSFFPPSKRGVITDNLSIDNMSLSGEEEDLHLTPPRPLARKCPCDPRSWMERHDLTHGSHHGDSSRSVGSRPCVIS